MLCDVIQSRLIQTKSLQFVSVILMASVAIATAFPDTVDSYQVNLLRGKGGGYGNNNQHNQYGGGQGYGHVRSAVTLESHWWYKSAKKMLFFFLQGGSSNNHGHGGGGNQGYGHVRAALV